MRSDYRLVDRLSDKLRERMLRAETAHGKKPKPEPKLRAHFRRGPVDWVKTAA